MGQLNGCGVCGVAHTHPIHIHSLTHARRARCVHGGSVLWRHIRRNVARSHILEILCAALSVTMSVTHRVPRWKQVYRTKSLASAAFPLKNRRVGAEPHHEGNQLRSEWCPPSFILGSRWYCEGAKPVCPIESACVVTGVKCSEAVSLTYGSMPCVCAVTGLKNETSELS